MYPGNSRVIGTCSICGGNVFLPIIWHGVVPPEPTCCECGAVAKTSGPTIPMEPRRPFGTGSSTIGHVL